MDRGFNPEAHNSLHQTASLATQTLFRDGLDSNHQHTVLETAALPFELHSYGGPGRLELRPLPSLGSALTD